MAKAHHNGNGRLEQAMAKLTEGHNELEQALRNMLQTSALFQQNQTVFLAQIQETNREIADLRRQSDQRFARIESILLDHSRILTEHTRILQALPEAVREKIGFKMPP